MAWFDTQANAPAVVTDRTKIKKWVQGVGYVLFTEAIFWRTTTEYRGLTLAAADAYADSIATGFTNQVINIQATGGGGYTVAVTVDTEI